MVSDDLYSNLRDLVRMPFFKYFQVCAPIPLFPWTDEADRPEDRFIPGMPILVG